MSKLKKLLKALFLIAKEPALLNNVLNDENVNREIVAKRFGLHQGLKTIQLFDLFQEFDETVEPFCALDGGSTPLDIGLLKALAKIKPNCNYLEIGTWRGESVANIASIANQCISINLSDNEMLQIGLDKSYVQSHRFFSEKLVNVKHIQANSQTFDFSSLNETFDLIFIDGDHHFESVKKDSENAYSVLRNDDAIIVWHDYGNTPNDVRWDVLRGIWEGTPKEKRKHLYHVSNTLCAIYYNKEIKSRIIAPFEIPRHFFSVSIKNKMI